jgi:hypothetical protein
MKFLSVIDPNRYDKVDVNVEYVEENGGFVINALMFSGEVVFFKLKAVLYER